MAILKMKRLRLMVVRSRKEELLRELQRLGCVELSEIGQELQETEAQGLVRRESGSVMALKGRQNTLDHAVALLDKYAPAKSKLLSAKPEFEEEELLSDTGVEDALKLAEAITAADERVRRIGAEESRLQNLIESLTPWKDLDLPLETEGTERASVLTGSISSRIPLTEVTNALAEAAEEAELFPIAQDKSAHYVLLVCMKESLTAVQECLRGFGFTATAFIGMTGTPREGIAQAQESLGTLAEEKAAWTADIAGRGGTRDELKLASDRVGVQIAAAEAEDRMFGTETTVVLEGWMPEEKEAALEQVLERFDCAWETSEPDKDEYDKVPVQLKNNALTNSLNMVTNMYSLPAYGTVDPNPLMAPFFILFYGLMMADMGYGLIMIIAALVAMKKIKPRGGSLSFCPISISGIR